MKIAGRNCIFRSWGICSNPLKCTPLWELKLTNFCSGRENYECS